MTGDAGTSPLPSIPVLDVGPDFPMATLLVHEARAHAMLDRALPVPRTILRSLDRVSRRWLERTHNAQLPEIDAVAARLGRPGVHFLSVNYEWGCTVSVGPSPDGRTARLVRTLDWMTSGLGSFVIAARVQSPVGAFVTLTWPGFTGVLQAMARGRFAASINQAPMRKLGGGLYALDWLVNRARVWQAPHEMPAQLLRRSFETAPDFTSARRLLIDTPIAAPAIYTLAGISGDEACTIERTETDAHVIDGPACASNHWQAPGWTGHPRGLDSAGRIVTMRGASATELDPDFPWLVPPVLNKLTRLAMVADAATGRLLAQGYEGEAPVTQPLLWPK